MPLVLNNTNVEIHFRHMLFFYNGRYYLFFIDDLGAGQYVYYKQATSIDGLASAVSTIISGIATVVQAQADVYLDETSGVWSLVYYAASGVVYKRIYFAIGSFNGDGSLNKTDEYIIAGGAIGFNGVFNPHIIKIANDRWVMTYTFQDFITANRTFYHLYSNNNYPTAVGEWTSNSLAMLRTATPDYGISQIGLDDNYLLVYVLDVGSNLCVRRYDISTGVLAAQNASGLVTGGRYSSPLCDSLGNMHICIHVGADITHVEFNGATNTWSSEVITTIITAIMGITLTITSDDELYCTFSDKDGATYDLRCFVKTYGGSWVEKDESTEPEFNDIADFNNSPVAPYRCDRRYVAWNNVNDLYADLFDYIVVEFSVNTQNGQSPLTVQFTSDISSSVDTIYWDFGDGSDIVYNELNPIHIYNMAGYYYPIMYIISGGVLYSYTGDLITVTGYSFVPNPSSGKAPLKVNYTVSQV